MVVLHTRIKMEFLDKSTNDEQKESKKQESKQRRACSENVRYRTVIEDYKSLYCGQCAAVASAA